MPRRRIGFLGFAAVCALAVSLPNGALRGGEASPAEEAEPVEAETTELEPEAPRIQPDWRSDFESALKEAAASDRVILIYFRADWSQPCDWVDRGSFGKKKMVTYISRYFIPLRVDDTEETSPLSRRYGIRVYPTVLFLDPAGEPLHMVLGPRMPRQFYDIMEKVRMLPGLIQAQKASPDDLEANFSPGMAFADLNQLRRAAPFLKRAAELDPENKHGRRDKAELLLAMAPLEDGDSARVLENLDAYMARFGGSAEIPVAIYWKGTVLYRDGRLEEARNVFERLQKEFPTHAMTYKADKAIAAIDTRLRAREVEKHRGENYNQEKEMEPEG